MRRSEMVFRARETIPASTHSEAKDQDREAQDQDQDQVSEAKDQDQDREPTDRDLNSLSKIFCVPYVLYKNTICSNNIALQ